jgi:hypothetical protein
MLRGVKRELRTCSACGGELDSHEGVELRGAWFCSKCFVGQASDCGRELRPEELARLRRLGKESSGFLPPDLLEKFVEEQEGEIREKVRRLTDLEGSP